MLSKIYRTAFVVQNIGHDFSGLLDSCESIEFLTTGYEPEHSLLDVILLKLAGFIPETDVLVPVGRVAANLLVGAVMFSVAYHSGSFVVAHFRDKEYHFQPISVDLLKGWSLSHGYLQSES